MSEVVEQRLDGVARHGVGDPVALVDDVGAAVALPRDHLGLRRLAQEGREAPRGRVLLPLGSLP
jgi:hypothetical protein